MEESQKDSSAAVEQATHTNKPSMLLKAVGIGTLVVFVIGINMWHAFWQRPISRSEQQSTSQQSTSADQEAAEAPQRQGAMVQAGGLLCNTAPAAIRGGMIARADPNSIVDPAQYGCARLGASLRVNVLRTISLGGQEVVLVGNQGGSAWTLYEFMQ